MNTDDSLTNIFGQLQSEKLSMAEHQAGRESLQSFMTQNPVRLEASERLTEHMTHQQAYSGTGEHLTPEEFAHFRADLRAFIAARPVREATLLSSFFSLAKMAATPLLAALCLVVVSAGTVAYAAEGSVPGDTLYSFKIRFTENVLATIYGDEEEGQALWTMKRFERRLKESNELIARQEAGAERWETMDRAVEELQRDTGAFLAALEERGRKEVALTLRKHLDTTVDQNPLVNLDHDDSPRGKLIARFKAMRPRALAQEIAPAPTADLHVTTSASAKVGGQSSTKSGPVNTLIHEIIAPLAPASEKSRPASETKASVEASAEMRMMIQTSTGSVHTSSSSSSAVKTSEPQQTTSAQSSAAATSQPAPSSEPVRSSEGGILPPLPLIPPPATGIDL